MKVPISMLRSLVDTPLGPEALGEMLTMLGHELEEILPGPHEPVLDVNVMANRGDVASVFGLARELLAKDPAARSTDLYKRLASGLELGDEEEPAAGRLATAHSWVDECPLYAFRVIQNVSHELSPPWLRTRLESAGFRPISLLVDLTNYVMLETGQPLHAFDLDKLSGQEIIVRHAAEGETLVTLDGVERKLEPNMTMICDASRPVAVAGVMGGLDTEVDETTRTCLLESAHFQPTSVRRTRKALGLATEASYRFERFVDPNCVVRALNRFCNLYHEITGAGPVPGAPTSRRDLTHSSPIPFRTERASKLLGFEVEPEEAVACLAKLGCRASADGEAFSVIPPSWRADLEREEDLVEEVGRILGYDRIPSLLPEGRSTVGGPRGFEAATDALRAELLANGFDQIVSHSLRARHPLSAETHPVKVRVPASPEASELRTSLLPGLAEAAVRNGAKRARLFEIGRVFEQVGEDRFAEHTAIALLGVGKISPDHFLSLDSDEESFFSLKGVLESLADCLARPLEFEPGEDPRLHPTRQARVLAQGVPIGRLGQIHPAIAEQSGLAPTTQLAELDANALYETPAQPWTQRTIGRNPSIRRDIAVVVSKQIPYAQIEALVREAAGPRLERMWLFDIYQGPGIDEGSHSLALALQIREPGRNLTDEEANQVRDRVVAALETLGAKLR